MKLLNRLGKSALLCMVAMLPLKNIQAADKETVLRFSNWQSPAHFITTDMLKPWAKEVEEVTEGRVKIEFINPLGKPQAHFDLVRNGVADMAMSVHSYTASRFPLVEFAELPFTTENSVHNSIAYWKTYEKFMLDANEHRGLKLLGAWTSPASVIILTKDKINSLNELNGVKLRTPSPLFDTVSKELGATPITAPASEAYEMLSRGVIDGMYFQHDQVYSFKLDRLIKSVVVAPGGFGKTSQYLFMNERKWKELSEKDREAIDKITGLYVAEKFSKIWQNSEDKAIKQLRDEGVTTYHIEGEELAKLKSDLAHIETDWLKIAEKNKVDGKAALAYYREQLKELEKSKD